MRMAGCIKGWWLILEMLTLTGLSFLTAVKMEGKDLQPFYRVSAHQSKNMLHF